ncbi:two-component system, chemotaxis family, chemotaxis protein CheY [Gammaproteobacteria bacterium]
MKKLQVLIIDDVNLVRDFVRHGLGAVLSQVEVLEAVNGRHAQGVLETKPVDLVLCDWEMPEVNGQELLLWIRAHERLKDLPFIMVTGRTERNHVVTALRAGIDGYVVKPFSIDALAEKIREVLTKRGVALGAPPVSAIPSDAVAILTGSHRKEDAGQKKRNPLARMNATIHFGEHTIRCLAKRLDLVGITVTVLREEAYPAILEPVVLDLILSAGTVEVIGLNALVSVIEAIEPNPTTRFLQLTLHFVDEDSERRKQLARLIETL